MSDLEIADLEYSATARLASQTDQAAEPSVLPPFCGKLSEDEGLKLSNQNFKQLIKNCSNTNITLLSQVQRNPTFRTPHLLARIAIKAHLVNKWGYFFKGNVVSPISQLTEVPTFPTPHVLAQFAYKAYEDYKEGETDPQYERRLDLPDGWKLLTTASNGSKTNGYFGVAYWHPEHQQVVIAHRGTDSTNLGALAADVKGMQLNHCVSQMDSACTFAHKIAEVLREVSRMKGVSFQLFFTGHALGGWLAQVTTFTTEYLKREGNIFLRSNYNYDCYHPHTVVFDSPGCKGMLSEMRDTFDVRLDGRSIDLEHLDITSYLSAPNPINTCNAHLGTVYRIFPDLTDMGQWEGNSALYNLATHSMDKIVKAFDHITGQVYKDEQGQLKVQVVVDWPISAGLKCGKEYSSFLEWAKNLNNYHPDIKNVSFQHLCLIRYQTKLFDERVNSLSIFSEEEQEFLQSYHRLRKWPEFCKPKELFAVMKNDRAQEQAEKILQNFEIENEKICCTDVSALQALIPYVKRFLHLFPEIKEFRNRVYQYETSSCIEQMKQSPLDFNPDSLSVREFLENKQQQVLLLEMDDGDEWTGLMKVYQVLQKTDCLIEGQYTVLKLERLLILNMLMDFRTLMLSIKAPYLILVACEANQLLKAETKDMIRIFFETMKQNPFIKIIFTAQSEDRATPSLQNISRDKFGDAFVTKVEHLTWCDLTSSSQEKLLAKSVIFQDANILLKQIMSAEFVVPNFLPLGALLEGKKLKIADPVPNSNSYDERYYIGRTLCCQKAIKQKISSDKDVKEKHVFLVSTEQEFKQLCQMNPNSNVHWLEKDKSGKLVWQQSQGSLETLRRYMDTDSSHTYTADDLDKLLEHAQHQRVMLISDTAGMGKSTLLTHLSKQIKQKFPAKWVVRIDLNDHTDTLKALKGKQIDKEKVIEFVSEKLLKLEPGLEMELFKRCCEQRQKVRVVIMLDSFYEISAIYKQTVIDLLQALRQTAVEQLWVTTRPHLRNELEDKLQQLSYTLEPFSEENQVEFLTKFWSLKDWFTEMNNKGKEASKKKLEIYAKQLIKKLSISISDKDREFTGTPLQTRILAEASDEEVKVFYLSTKSVPELPLKLELLELYRRFIERKYDIYQEEKLQVSVNKAVATEQREHDLKIMKEDHQLMALKVLFNEEHVALFHNNSQCTLSGEQLTRIGIVQVRHDGKLHFIHRTFAEYYVADCLVNRLTEGNNTSQQVQNFILMDIFQKEQHQVIRAFIDGLLSRSKISKEMLKQYGKGIHELGECAVIMLHRAAQEENSNIVAILLDSLHASENSDTLRQLLLAQDNEGKSAYFMATERDNIQVLEKLWECANEKLTTEEINNKLLLATDNAGMTAWQRAAYTGNLDILLQVWEWAENRLTTEEINNKLLLATDIAGMTAWHRAALKGNLDILLQLWKWAEEKLTKEEINNKLLLATDTGGTTTLHKAACERNLGVLLKIWEWAEEKLTTEEINKKLLLATDNAGMTACHWAVKWGTLEILQKIWEWAKEKLTTEEINNKLLLATDNKRLTAWHWAAYKGKLDVMLQVWEWAQEKLTTEEINNKLLLATEDNRMTVWHWAAYNGKLDILLQIWEWAEENLTTEEINNKLLLATDNAGMTAWQWAAYNGKLDILLQVWEWAEEKLTTEEINNELLLATDSVGMTAWHRAAYNRNLDILLQVWEWAEEKLTTEEINNKLLLATDNAGKIAWHDAAKWGTLEIMQKIWDGLKIN